MQNFAVVSFDAKRYAILHRCGHTLGSGATVILSSTSILGSSHDALSAKPKAPHDGFVDGWQYSEHTEKG